MWSAANEGTQNNVVVWLTPSATPLATGLCEYSN